MSKKSVSLTDYNTNELVAEKVFFNHEGEGETSKRFYCYECKFLFSRKALLDKHMENHLRFQCPKCKYTKIIRMTIQRTNLLTPMINITSHVSGGNEYPLFLR